MSEWREIESDPPPDNTAVDLWVLGARKSDGTYREFRSPGCWRVNGGDWYSPVHGDHEYGGGRMWAYKATHWMHVPKGPNE